MSTHIWNDTIERVDVPGQRNQQVLLSDGFFVARVDHIIGPAFAERICETFNACAGIADPAAEIARLRESNKELADALRDLLLVSENADETGYVDGEGWLPIERIQEAARAALAKHEGREA